MAPSHTVENYLKAIFQAQLSLAEPTALVPMGQLASTLGVVPGTATTMVKALADSGLVRYEPYAGVRLTAAGEKLAALVLRRHRLIELFLVKVMGMSWTEVHDDAENLEHAVSDRLIERIDAMLGHPEVDPHGDPIPGPEGTVRRQTYDSLLTCPLDAPVTISRVSDQDREFLEFVERHELKPGEVVRVEERDPAGDSVRLRGRTDRTITIGARAASKVLVKAVTVVLLCLWLASQARAQTPAPPPAQNGGDPFKIADNSFLVEEAFNQEAGIFQNIVGVVRLDESWQATFTQEWPVRSQKHQLSYTIPFGSLRSAEGVGDVLLNYRYQLLEEGPGRPAFSPRLSLVLPTGNERRGWGEGSLGLQTNLPFSKQHGDIYYHWNAGLTVLPGVSSKRFDPAQPVDDVTLVIPQVAASAIWRTLPMMHLMLETVLVWPETLDEPGVTKRSTAFTLSPGVRGGWNVADQQIIVGIAVPVTWASAETEAGIFGYLSYELPFKR
jgi:DtxR family Mn-dependent transcriptional regulator